MSMQTDVIIVGAGSAGLSAAKELTRLGVSFVVLEASHRIGGRAYSEEIAPDTWFDLGCAYMDVGPEPDVRADESKHTITVQFLQEKTNLQKIKKTITSIGYDADNLKANKAAYNKLNGCCKKPK